MDPQFEGLFNTLREHQAAMIDAQRKAKEIAATVTAAKHAFSVTVDAQGVVTDLSFPTEAYRTMAPRELAALVRESIVKARGEAAAQMSALMTPFIPEGVSLEDMASGKLDWEKLLPPMPGRLDEPF